MAINIKNETVENLIEDVVALTGESKTEAVRVALYERHQRLLRETAVRNKSSRLSNFLQGEVWPQIPPEMLGTRLTKAEEEAILGYGEDGV